jgi:peptidoglycan/xylan/chitin deacetylase (PgdA/CDA1 family)
VWRSILSLLSPSGPNGRLSVLIFHRVHAAPDPLMPDEMDSLRFDRQMSWVRGWFNVLPLHEAVQRLQERTLPARALCITFDDGYADNCTVALPILRKHGLEATFFISPGYTDGGCMWNDVIIETVRHTKAPRLEDDVLGLGALPLHSIEDRRQAVERLIQALKYLPDQGRASTALSLADAAGVSVPMDLMLTSSQVKALRAAGMSIGAHTITHPILTQLQPSAAFKEITESKARLEAMLGEPVSLFAYPNGKPGRDYGAEHVEMVRRAGFTAAVSTAWGVASAASDSYQLPRFTPWDEGPFRYGLRCAQNLLRSRHAQV